MANRRMFSKIIVDSDDFLDMPVSARLLYYDLGMRADDDGFVNPKRVIRLTGSATDDLKILLVKKYVLSFEDKILVIKDWKVNNFIRPDRYTPTIYKEYLKQLETLETKQYKLSTGIPNDIPEVDPVKDRLGKDRLGKDSIVKSNKPANADKTQINLFIEKFKPVNPTYERLFGNKTEHACMARMLKKFGAEKMEKIIDTLPDIFGKPYAPVITTPYLLEIKMANLFAYLKQRSEEQSKKSTLIL